MTKKSSITIFGALFTLFFCAYFTWLSEMLPRESGPDELAHIRAANFVYEHERLAIYPQDEDIVHYAPSGSTRSFRPPMTYMVSGALRHASDALGVEFNHPYRKSNALFGGLCALFLLLGIFAYTHNTGLAVGFTAVFMLMPQVSFIFTYLNADGAALMAVSLVLLSITMLISKGVNARTLMMFGIACGVLSLCKLTAWVVCLPLCIYAVLLILKSGQGVVKPALIVFMAFAITGGWRIASNVYHHGIENVFNWTLEAQLLIVHVRDSYVQTSNFSLLDYSYLDMLGNAENFLTKTFYSFVGNLDWLRLTVGPLQYTFYGAILVLGLIACLSLLARPFVPGIYDKRRYWFELSILVSIVLQIYMYFRFNMYHDLQTQGKYVIPAFAGFILILVSFLHRAGQRYNGQGSSVFVSSALLPLFLATTIYIHLQALYKYVIPFYYSNAFVDTSQELYKPINYLDEYVITPGDLELLNTRHAFSTWQVTGPDPRLNIQDVNLNESPGLILLRICFWNSKDNYYNIYWDPGTGASEETMVKGFSSKGNNIIYQILPISAIKHVRFDLGTPGSSFTLMDLAYTRLKYKPWAPFLNRLFFVKATEDSL